MGLKETLIEINTDVKDIVKLGFELTQCQNDLVPHYEDPGLTFESGKAKKAKLIETCVLYADIRKSTELSKTHSKETMARLYTAFVKSVLNIAEHHGAVIRNIIGDRVMVVFCQNDCFTSAVDTAISINTVASRIINKHFTGLEFKCGIGIDYGQMKVIKAGIPKHDKERTNYKNLVWIGNPANIASKLTDVANKEIIETVYKVTRHPNNPKAWRMKSGLMGVPTGQWERVVGQPEHLTTIETVELSPEEFAASIFFYEPNGSISTLNGKMIKCEKKEKKTSAAPILMSQKVWEEFKKSNPNRTSILSNSWKKQDLTLKEYKGQIIGGDVYWTTIDEIAL